MNKPHSTIKGPVGLEDYMRSPEQYFSAPAEIEKLDALVLSDKVLLLKQWRDQIVQLQQAEAENMTESASAGQNRRLAEINAVLARLKA